MLRFRLLAVACTVFAVLVAASVSNAAAPLVGTVGPDSSFKITLTSAGKPVKTLKAGKVTIVVKDTASVHNFHLTGPGLNKLTPVAGKGTFTWHLTLKRGVYKFVCDPHKSFMKGSFTVK
jgi:hypothetical protein